MILCPNCLHKEMVGAFFCSECGAQIVDEHGTSTSTFPSSKGRETTPFEERPYKKQTGRKEPHFSTGEILSVALKIVTGGEILSLHGQKEVTLGRVGEGQSSSPDIDLTPYKAYEAGVSRMHSSISIIEDQAMVTDLGSANGTRINGMKITSHIPYPINNGDILTLGKLKIQVLIRNKESRG
jgi:pSer/pThr/pTyr-binding forkhead associated (FHA) protein